MAHPSQRAALSPENLGLLEAVARLGSMAAAARELGMVPSALTYRVRQIEDALDVLLFDRSARRAQLTPLAPSCCAPASTCWTNWTLWPSASNAWPPAGNRS